MRLPATEAPPMKGFFAIGVQGISKTHNVGNLLRTSHAFGASFFFTIDGDYDKTQLGESDTSAALGGMPVYDYTRDTFTLPRGVSLVGVELTDDAVPLPSFHHPRQAVYLLGPEGGSISPDMLARCDYTVKIPMRFCVNVGVAGAIVMYDRLMQLGRQAPRPLMPGGPIPAGDLPADFVPPKA